MAIDLILSSETEATLTDNQLDSNFSTIQTAVNTLQVDLGTAESDITALQSAVDAISPLTPPSYYTQLILREQKGSALTNAELDSNFIHLDVRNNNIATQLDVLANTTIPALTSSNTAALATKQGLNAKLTSLSALSTSGFVVANSNTILSRAITAGSPYITVTNGNGVAGDPVINIGTDVVLLNSTQTLTSKTISGAANTITNVSLTTGVTGILPLAQGGTNANTPADARAQLQVLINPVSTGIVAKTGSDSTVGRQLAVSGVGLSVTNSDGVLGNPTITSSATSANTPSTPVSRDASGNFTAGVITATLNGNAAGNAGTVTNGVYTTGSYSNPAWITALAGSKVTSIPNSSLVNSSITINGTTVSLGGSATIDSIRQAWVKFNGTTGAIIKAKNVTGVTKIATGTYRINVTSGVFADSDMIVIGTASDDDHVVTYSSSTSTQVIIKTHDSGMNSNNQLQDTSGTVHVMMVS